MNDFQTLRLTSSGLSYRVQKATPIEQSGGAAQDQGKQKIGTKYQNVSGIEGVRVEPAREACRQFHHKISGLLAAACFTAWGGAQANGGNYFVKRAHDVPGWRSWPEHASSTPMASAAAAKRKPTLFKTFPSRSLVLNLMLLQHRADGVAKAAEALLKTLEAARQYQEWPG